MISLFTDPTPAGGLVLATLLALATAAGVGLATDRPAPMTAAEIERGILALVADYPGHPLRRQPARAAALAADIHAAQEAHGVPGEILVAIARRESSLAADGRAGPAGEVGVMQVHPATGRRYRCDLTTQSGQVDCGARVLASAHARCGSWRGAIHVYVSRAGTCETKSTRVAWVARDRLAIASRVRAAGMAE